MAGRPDRTSSVPEFTITDISASGKFSFSALIAGDVRRTSPMCLNFITSIFFISLNSMFYPAPYSEIIFMIFSIEFPIGYSSAFILASFPIISERSRALEIFRARVSWSIGSLST
ncbi:hypothetical protein BMS3Bbin09_01222 [bacterium BMS3Bbin09]|nr:hypothetical protein BMS3Bbin09_01222 [bacterium BMS3Bbin09]